jgi:tRNA(fMet)-specific endonuclease VapC
MYLLDTNICIFLKNRKPVQVLERLKSVIDKDVFISSISVAELQYGVYNSQNVEKNRTSLVEFLAPFEILDFDDDDAEQCGLIRAQLRREGKIIGPYDMLIAAQAIAKSLILITNNSDEFTRVNGLIIEDWKYTQEQK